MVTAEQVIASLNLQEYPAEGGYFKEMYRASDRVVGSALPSRYGGTRVISTAIYYMLTTKTFSIMHRLQSDEIWHFYLGSPVEMVQLFPDGSGKLTLLGNDVLAGERPQIVVPRGVWQGARVRPGAVPDFALMGTTVAPGFEFRDHEAGDRAKLTASYPMFKDIIVALTR